MNLMSRPFSLEEAKAAGISSSMLRGKSWLRIGSRLYRSSEGANDRLELIAAHSRMLPASAVFIGLTAAWLHGLDVETSGPIEVALPSDNHLRSRAGLLVRHCNIGDDVVMVRCVSASNLSRTLLDLCARLSPVEALVAIDMAFVAELTDKATLRHYADTAKGRRGVARLKSLAEIAAPAESPMETRLRWLLLSAGLPAPEVQTDLYDREGVLLGRADLYYPSAHLVIEFDGRNHQDRLVSDNRRQNALHHAGYQILRFTSPDLYGRPKDVVALTRAALNGT